MKIKRGAHKIDTTTHYNYNTYITTVIILPPDNNGSPLIK